MKRLALLIILVVILAGLVLSRLSDTSISIADTSTSNNEVTSTISKTGNSSASATITIESKIGMTEMGR